MLARTAVPCALLAVAVASSFGATAALASTQAAETVLIGGPAFATAAPTLADCDSASHATVLQPAPAGPALEARAIWLDATRLRWPGVEPGGRFRLHHSARGSVVAKPGEPVSGSDGALDLEPDTGPLPAAIADRFRHVATGVTLGVPADAVAKPHADVNAGVGSVIDRRVDVEALRDLHRQQLLLVQETADGRVIRATRMQSPGALDALYGAAGNAGLGAHVAAEADPTSLARRASGADPTSVAGTASGTSPPPGSTRFALWAPTARNVALCLYRDGSGPAGSLETLQFDDRTGVWSTSLAWDLSGQYYTYLVDVHVDGAGVVRNRVTDPYAVSLTTDSRRGYIADLDSPHLKPKGWDQDAAPDRVKRPTDAVIYELHVRDFSINDATVRPDYRGKYLAFTLDDTEGSKHLRSLAKAGVTDVHLLPVFDLGTVPEVGCVTPTPSGAPDGETQQQAVMAVAARDCFNWGYDPVHYTAPEGSYATDPADGAVRVLEFRRMVQALHAKGLRVGMDVVYNHTYAAGQDRWSVLDRIVPGYYHRLDEAGRVTTSTCCFNTATEHRMMRKLMIDSVVTWATQYRIDSFRFDLMGHQPRAAMEELRARVIAAAGRDVLLIGEGWNFGEVADGARFVQASQLSLNGSGIATFSDRARDAIRGGGAGDNDIRQVCDRGYINSAEIGDTHLFPSAEIGERPQFPEEIGEWHLFRLADMVRVGLAGSLRDFRMQAYDGRELRLEEIPYGGGQPAGYVTAPGEVVNYVENHDNQTLYDLNAFKLPLDTPSAERARVQNLAAALNAFSQGIAYFHAGQELLRSKSMDRNSFDSGDWFNRLDWTGKDNYFGTGLPPARDNATSWPLMRPRLADPRLKPTPSDIAWTRQAFNDLLRIRSSSSLFRMATAADIKARLKFYNTGPSQVPEVIAGHLDGRGYPGAAFAEVLYLVNVDTEAQTLQIDAERDKRYVLHPVHREPGSADRRAAEQSRYDAATGRFIVPARTAVVFVVNQRDAGSTGGGSASAELLIATYNLRYAGADAPPNDWPSRRPRIKAVLDQYRPDLLGTQEGLYHQIKDVAADQPDYAWIGLGRDGGHDGEFMAIFYRRDRFELLEYDYFSLSDTPEVVASSTWGNDVRRMVSWARFRDLRSGREFYFWDTHFDHAVQYAREKSAELVRKRIDALPRNIPVFLVGDFNAVARDNRAYDILTTGGGRNARDGLTADGGLTDTWYAARERRNEDANSFTGFEPLRHEGRRIDWILARGPVDVRAAEAVTLQPGGQWPSDHLPVMAWVTLLNGAK